MFTRSIPSFIAAVCLIAGVSLVAQQPASTPAASAPDMPLRVLAPHHDPVTLTAANLKAMPHMTVIIHNTHTNVHETYSGARVANLLAKVGTPLGDDLRGKALAQYIVATGSDGYQTVVALGEVDPAFHPGEVLVVDTMDGKPLDAHSGPLQLVVTEDKYAARSVRNLVQIELKSVQ